MKYELYYDVGFSLVDGWFENDKPTIPSDGGYYKEIIEAPDTKELYESIKKLFEERWPAEYVTYRCYCTGIKKLVLAGSYLCPDNLLKCMISK